jgi:uncharacterized protein
VNHALACFCVAGCLGSLSLAAEPTLVDFIKNGNLQAVKTLVAAHADVNAVLPDGSTPLAWAAYEDDAAVVDLLLKSKAKAATADEYGETPLTLACANGNPSIAGKLLDAGADANAGRWNGETPLMIAARSGNPRLVRLLLDHGAKIDAVEARKGQDALMGAAAAGHAEAVDVLVKAGAKANGTSKAGFSPLIFAAQNGDVRTVEGLLAAGADAEYAAPPGMTALLVAMGSRKLKVAELLMARGGANVTARDRDGNTLLHSAAQLGDLDMAKALITKGADVNAKTEKPQGGRGGNRGPSGGQTPLMLAARANHVDVMHALIAAGADPKLKAQDGTTLLMAAAGSGHIEAVQYAYELSPDIAAVTTGKQTVIHAALAGTLQNSTPQDICSVIIFLADKGADVTAADATGKTPQTLAVPIDGAGALIAKLSGGR